MVRSPTFTKRDDSSTSNGSRPESRNLRGRFGKPRGRAFATAAPMASMCSGVVPQQPPTRLTRPDARELADQLRHKGGRLVVAAELVRQSGIRMHADIATRRVRERFDMGPQLFGTERAVQPGDQRLCVRDGYPERFRGLSRQRPAARVGDRAGDHHRQPHAGARELGLDGEDRRLGVQRIEHGFDHDQVDATGQETAHCLGISLHKGDERDVASAWVVDVG